MLRPAMAVNKLLRLNANIILSPHSSILSVSSIFIYLSTERTGTILNYNSCLHRDIQTVWTLKLPPHSFRFLVLPIFMHQFQIKF